MEKIKPLIPTLREKKRYISFEIITDSNAEFPQVRREIMNSFQRLYGEKGVADAGIIMLSNLYSSKTKKGVIRVSHKNTDKLRLSLAMVKKIDGKDAIIKSIKTSGMLKKASESAMIKP